MLERWRRAQAFLQKWLALSPIWRTFFIVHKAQSSKKDSSSLTYTVHTQVCKSGKCENVLGSFRCLCDDGYSVKGRSGPEEGCTDDDECALDIFHCDPFAECKNTNGSYDCICREGFTGDGFNCQVREMGIFSCFPVTGGIDSWHFSCPIFNAFDMWRTSMSA